MVVENSNAVNEDQNRNIQEEFGDECHIQSIENGNGHSRRGILIVSSLSFL